MKQDIVTLAALGAIAAFTVRQLRVARRQATQPKAKPVELQRWESEGGGLPVTPKGSRAPGASAL